MVAWAGSARAQDTEMAAIRAPELDGEQITILGPWLGAEAEALNNVLDPFREMTGAEVIYEGTSTFEQDIILRTDGSRPPNLSAFPQPGLAAELAREGKLAPLSEATSDWILNNYAAGESWLELGSFAGPDGDEALYGFFYNVSVKSLVWYSPTAFAAAGYSVPETFEDLLLLSARIAENGTSPWCIGLGSGEASGWPATDWVEDLLLRTQPPEVYDAWTGGEIPFDDPRVLAALELFGRFASDAWTNGGAEASASIDYRDAATGLFTEPPQCYLHKQASFITPFFPEDVALGRNASFFYFPSFASQDLGEPVLGAGTLWAMTNDSEGARALLEYLKTPLAHELWMARGGFLTPHLGVDTALYADSVLRGQGDILRDATTFRFDGSDLMPGAVGAGAFWEGMLDLVRGATPEEVAGAIQEVWEGLR